MGVLSEWCGGVLSEEACRVLMAYCGFYDEHGYAPESEVIAAQLDLPVEAVDEAHDELLRKNCLSGPRRSKRMRAVPTSTNGDTP